MGHRGTRDAARTVMRLSKTIRDLEPDVIHSFSTIADAYSTIAATGRRARVFGTFVSTAALNDRRSLLSVHGVAHRLRRLSPRLRPHRWFAIGDTVRARAIEAGISPEQICSVPPGFDVEGVRESANEMESEWLIGEGLIPIIVTGRLMPSKRVHLLISALTLLDARCVLLVAGVGAELERLMELAQREGVAQRVFFLGDRGDVPALLRRCAVYVTATEYEGLVGYSTLEAVAVGVPTVAPAIPEIVEVLNAECAYLFHQASPAAIAEQVSFVLSGEADDRTTEALRVVREKFDLNAIGAALRTAYLE
jgi:glycosyltransferase involved in cell wall biosynthesis